MTDDTRGDGLSRDPEDLDQTIIQPGDQAAGDSGETPAPDQTILQDAASQDGAGQDGAGQDALGMGGRDGGIDATVVDPGVKVTGAGPSGRARHAEVVKPKVFASRFEVVEQLGEGGMGVVYQARDRQIEGREIALKVLRPRFSRNAAFRDLFFKEIDAAQRFVSEHVVQVRDTGKSKDGTLFLTMDLVNGEPLDGVLARENSLNERHALEVARQALIALASGHEHGFVHRDVKPQNIMLAARVPKTEDNPFGVGVRLLDFGIAGLAAQVEEGQIIGTPRYMSPEQVQGQRLDARSDLFAVGVVLYEMLAGVRPFDGDTPEEVSTSILETNVAPLITELDNLSDPIRKLLKKALQKNRDKRFQSAGDFIKAIESSKAFREKRGVPLWVGGLLVVTTAIAGVEAWMLWGEKLTNLRLETKKDVGVVALRTKHEKELSGIRAEAQDQVNELRERISELSDKLVSASTNAKRAESDAAQISLSYQEAVEERRRLEDRLRKLEEEHEKINRKGIPTVAAARFADKVIRLIKVGSPDAALNYLQARLAGGEPDVPAGEGADYVTNVLEAAAALDRAQRLLMSDGRPIDPVVLSVEDRQEAFGSFRRGQSALAEATSGAGAFEVESANWIRESADLSQEPVDRIAEFARICAALVSTEETLAEAVAAVQQTMAAKVRDERAALLTLSLSEDPTAFIQHMQIYAEDLSAVLPAVDRLAADAESAAVIADTRTAESSGQLDSIRLTTMPTLRQWGEYFVDEGRHVDSPGATTFRWLWAAAQFYEGIELDRMDYAFLKRVPDVTSTEPYADWRAQLALQFEFSKSMEQYLGDHAGVSVFRHASLAGGATRIWYHDELGEDGSGRWQIERKRVDSTGRFGPAQTIQVALRGGVLSIAGTPTLDVRSNADYVSVARWEPTLVEPLPDQAWSRGMNHDRFRHGVGGGLPCLVFRAGKAMFWFSPGHGLVRHEVDGVFERELSFSAGVR